MKNLLVILVFLFMILPAFSQTRVVRGKLTTYNTYPVQNVEVVSKKTKSAVLTDSLGQFELVCSEKDMITIKTKVFDQISERIGPEEDYISVNLIFQDSRKNREIATGMGYLKPDQLSYALAHLSDQNYNFCMYSNIFSLLTANFPEVQVMTGTVGSPGGVYLRGQKSFNLETQAVYEVDGMIVSDISFVIPCEVASINILKSGGTAVYGTQAVNGVVIIKTKGY